MIDLSHYSQQHLLILGLGREGQATLSFFINQSPQTNLTVADQKSFHDLEPKLQKFLTQHSQIDQQLGSTYLDNLDSFDTIFRSPGIPPFLPQLQPETIKKKLSSETQLFFSHFPGTIIGVTGSKGKSTTTKLIHDILIKAEKPAVLVGNIGTPSISTLPTATQDTIAVYELSSHQLFDLNTSPYIAVLLNIFPEHLDYYPDFDTYKKAKTNITTHQTQKDYLVFDPHQDSLQSIVTHSKATKIRVNDLQGHVFAKDGNVFINQDGSLNQVISTADIPLLGNHNLTNVIHAIAATSILGVSRHDQAVAIKSFQALPHRLQLVGEYLHVKFYNDSLSTNPEAAVQALQSVPNVSTLIIGGSDRKRSYSQLAQALSGSSVTTVIVLAKDPQPFLQALSHLPQHIQVLSTKSLKQAVIWAYEFSSPDTACILSPGAPSFDLFKNYEDRGNQFIEFVKSYS